MATTLSKVPPAPNPIGPKPAGPQPSGPSRPAPPPPPPPPAQDFDWSAHVPGEVGRESGRARPTSSSSRLSDLREVI